MNYTDLRNDKALTLGAVNQTLVTKISSFESAMQELSRSVKQNDSAAWNRTKRTNASWNEVKCLVDTLTDEKGIILSCANWILSQLQKGFYYDRQSVLLAAEDAKYYISDVNTAMSVLESCGFIGSRIIDNTDAIYLTENHHKWIVTDLKQEDTRS